MSIHAEMMHPAKHEAWHAGEKQDETNFDGAVRAEEFEQPLHVTNANPSLSPRPVSFWFQPPRSEN
jgi:hypothetical protein